MSMKSIIRDFPNGSVIKNSLANAGDTVRSLGREDPLEKEMATHSSIAAAAAAASLQLCPTLCDPIDSSPPGSPVPGILQARTWVGCRFLLQCMKVKSDSEVTQSCLALRDPWTAAYQAPPSVGFSRQEYWSGLPLPSLFLAWEIPWTEEPGRLPSMGSQRVGHDWVRMHTSTYILVLNQKAKKWSHKQL